MLHKHLNDCFTTFVSSFFTFGTSISNKCSSVRLWRLTSTKQTSTLWQQTSYAECTWQHIVMATNEFDFKWQHSSQKVSSSFDTLPRLMKYFINMGPCQFLFDAFVVFSVSLVISMAFLLIQSRFKLRLLSLHVFFAFFSKFLINLRRRFRVRKICSWRQFCTQVFVGFAVFSFWV